MNSALLMIMMIVSNTLLKNISDHDISDDRNFTMISAIGYLLHGFKDKSNTRAIILVDEKIPSDDDQANGGTGKSLFCDAIALSLLPNSVGDMPVA